MKSCARLITGLSLPLLSIAQHAIAADDSPPSRWGLGVGTVITDSPYAGEGARLTPFPLVLFEGERFFFRGITGGVHVFETPSLSLDAVVQARFDGIDRDDFGVAELAENGIDRSLLEDRDDGLDAGFVATWEGSFGELELEVLADVTDASGGQEASLTYGYEFEWGRTSVEPHIGITYLTDDMANYYYGTLPQEQRRGVMNYRPDSVTIPTIGVSLRHSFGEKWALMGNIEYSSLPDEIADSPLMEADDSLSLLLGVWRSF